MLINTIQKLHHLGQIFLQNVKSFASTRKLGLWAGVVSVSGMTACVYGPVPDCCKDEYSPEQYEGDSDTLLYKKMCYQAMTFDSAYDLDSRCKLKKADQYIDAAKKCCEPLASAVYSTGSIGSDYHYGNGYWEYNDDRYKSIEPLNAYSWCLLNTHPRTYQCDLAKATEIESKSEQCCKNAANKTDCIADFMRSNGQYCNNASGEETCCGHLSDIADADNISKSECIEIYNNYGVCTSSPSVACCINLRDNTSAQYIDETNCQMLFRESNGEYCINSDELYEKYNSGELCCGDSPDAATKDKLSKADCMSHFNNDHQCIATPAQECCMNVPDLNREFCESYYLETNGEKCINTDEELMIASAKKLCCGSLSEEPMSSGLTKDICNNLFDENSECINSDELYNDYKANHS